MVCGPEVRDLLSYRSDRERWYSSSSAVVMPILAEPIGVTSPAGGVEVKA